MTTAKVCRVHIYGPSLASMPRSSRVRVPANAGSEEVRRTNRRIEAMQQENARARIEALQQEILPAEEDDPERIRNEAVFTEFKKRSQYIESQKKKIAELEATLQAAKPADGMRETKTQAMTRIGLTGVIKTFKEELKKIDVPTLVWQGERGDMRAFIDDTSKQSKRAVERDKELAERIASKKQLEDELLQIQRNPRNKHLLQAALYEVRQATDDIENFVRPSVAAGGDGRRTVIPAPAHIQTQIDIYMRCFADLQACRLENMTSASPDDLREMHATALGIDKCMQEILDELRAIVDAHDPAAGVSNSLTTIRKEMELFESPQWSFSNLHATPKRLSDTERGLRLLDMYDSKSEAKLESMRQALLEMDIDTARKKMEELQVFERLLDEDSGSRAAGS